MAIPAAIGTLARRDRAVVAAGLVAVTGLAWVYLLRRAGGIDDVAATMQVTAMPAFGPWSATEFALTLAMWAVMMVAMMTPSAAPMILLCAAIARKTKRQDRPAAHTATFAAGYLAVWTGFAALATALQWALEQAALLSPVMVAANSAVGGALLVAAGIYQMTPLKQVCLRHCRAPVDFLTRHWRPGAGGAFRMGLAHGAYCVGCCWALMTLLFVGGVMNLLWVAALAILVLVEKIAPHGAIAGRAAGALMALAGMWMVAAA